MRDYAIFEELLKKLTDGLEITFTEKNIAYGDNFLLLGRHHKKCTCTFRNYGIWFVYFENDEPMQLANCPDSFYKSILKNIK